MERKRKHGDGGEDGDWGSTLRKRSRFTFKKTDLGDDDDEENELDEEEEDDDKTMQHDVEGGEQQRRSHNHNHIALESNTRL